MNLGQYKHIIFDFDETLATLLVDWPMWHEQIVAVIKKYEPSFDEKTYLNMYSIHQYILKYGQGFRDDYAAFETAFEQKYYRGYRLIDKSFALLQELHAQGKNLYLLTSNSREVVLPILEELKIVEFFDKIVTLGDVSNLKPTTEPFKLITDDFSDEVSKSEFLMVGDSKSDSGFAENVGMDYLDVRSLS